MEEKRFDYSKQPGQKKIETELQTVTPLMTIITPYYNAAKYFEQTYNCVINQTFIWYEWIIVDDGSTKISDVDFLENLVKSDNRIKVYHKKNGGPAAARNYAVSKSNTDLIVSLDADDLIEPTYLEETYFALYFNPKASWAYSNSLGFGALNYVWKVYFDSEKLKKKNFLIEIGTYRKEIFEKVGGYDDAQRYSHEDWDLWLRFMAEGGYPVHIAGLLAWYRIVENGALHATNDHQEIRKRAVQRIKNTAQKITEKIDAIEYPNITSPGQYVVPKCSEFKQKKEKQSLEILVLLSSFEDVSEIQMTQQFISIVNQKDMHAGVMLTDQHMHVYQTALKDFTNDVFELPSFLEECNYPEFISYYIKTRQVDIILINGSSYAYGILPWLKNKFPNVYIAECNINKKHILSRNLDAYKTFIDRTYEIKKIEDFWTIVEEYKTIELKNKISMEELQESCLDVYMAFYSEVLFYKKKYNRFEQKVDAFYEKEARKRLVIQRFLDTKLGSLITEILEKVKNRV